MAILEEVFARGHEQVALVQDPEIGLNAIIAVHNTVLGPALGGCRLRSYPSYEAAMSDVLKLSEAMTYKNALCGINFGGGKAVIISDTQPQGEAREKLFSTFGRAVRGLGGSYITAEDMNVRVSDIMVIAKECDYVAGKDPAAGYGGDPSPQTAKGVFNGILACLERAPELGDISNVHVAVQGVGNVGLALVALLREAGAKVSVADTDTSHTDEAKSRYGASVVAVDAIATTACDVFAPCAVGGIINKASVVKLNCKIVAGAANNQLAEPEAEAQLAARGILYAPDFAINAGGVILCAAEFEPGGYSTSWVAEKVAAIGPTVGRILDESKSRGKLAGQIAIDLAKERIATARP